VSEWRDSCAPRRERGRKSTLIKALAGAIKPDSGTIMMRGEPAELGTRTESMRRGISVIFQHANLVPQLTVAQNIVLAERGVGLGSA